MKNNPRINGLFFTRLRIAANKINTFKYIFIHLQKVKQFNVMEKTKLKAALKQVNDYFRDKIVAGDYTVEERGERTYKLIIDGKYTFNLWIANGEDYFGCYDSSFSTNTMDVKFRFEDKLKAFKIIKKDIAETIGKEREAKEREEFKRLQKKFAQ